MPAPRHRTSRQTASRSCSIASRGLGHRSDRSAAAL